MLLIAIAVVLLLVVLNGLFAMTELAVVSSRKSKLQARAERGDRGARAALKLADEPTQFLSAVQVGITLIGILAGAYGQATIAGELDRILEVAFPAFRAYTEFFATALVVVCITYVSLIIGELVPKQFALRQPEPIAVLVATPMLYLAKLTAPVVWVLDKSSGLIFKLLGLDRESEHHVTVEELHLIVAEASRSGIIEESERAIISGVVRLADRPVREVMTQRMDVDWIDINADEDTVRLRLLETPHTRLPVGRGSVEDIIGIVQARDIMTALFRGEALNIEALLRKAEVVPDQVDAMDALEVLRKSDVPMVMVHDEYGHFEGIVTPADLLSAIAGHFASDRDVYDEPDMVEREDGSLLVSGQMPIDQLAEKIDINLSEDRDYATVAGHALWLLRRLPEVGDYAEDQGWRFEIVDMDGRRIDKLLVSRPHVLHRQEVAGQG